MVRDAKQLKGCDGDCSVVVVVVVVVVVMMMMMMMMMMVESNSWRD